MTSIDDTTDKRKNGGTFNLGMIDISGEFSKPSTPEGDNTFIGQDFKLVDDLKTDVKRQSFKDFPIGERPPQPPPSEATSLDKLATDAERNRKAQQAVASVGFVVDVINANSKFNNIKSKAVTNIFLAKQSVADAISRGKQQAFQLRESARTEGEKVALSLAAQGQDVSGASVQKAVGSFEVSGIYNSMIAEINASREALGFEQEISQYEGLIDQAETQRDFEILGSGLNFEAKSAFL